MSEKQDKPDVYCANCVAALRPENALMRDGEPYCDEFCYEHRMEYEHVAGAIPLAAGLHHDGTIHIYTHGKDAGLRIGLEPDGTLWVRVAESNRMMKVGFGTVDKIRVEYLKWKADDSTVGQAMAEIGKILNKGELE